MKNTVSAILLLLAATATVAAQTGSPDFAEASRSVQDRLEQSVAELSELRERIKDEKLALAEQLRALETELSSVRQEFQESTRTLDGSAQALFDLNGEIERAKKESDYLAKLFGDYIREFDASLHIAERQRHEALLDRARLAGDDPKTERGALFAIELETVTSSIDRLDDILGGTIFGGTTVDEKGDVKDGKILLLGPTAIFRALDGSQVGLVEQRVGSKQPASVPFHRPEDRKAAEGLVESGDGAFPLDPTLGNAMKMAETEETFLEHVKKGGPVMWPIFIMAGLGLVIALYKWLSFTFIRRPSRRQIDALLEAVGRHDRKTAEEKAADLRGPVGHMLRAGVAHLREPRELIEEVMYETVLKTRLRLERMLPFIAICAASAPLLGLLGTVTGIINTFKMITVFGSGDVKSLSGGISEALITTKFGLIVAIPSLLLHAFLSRKAKGVISQMETAAVGFVNQASRTVEGSAATAVSGGADTVTVPVARAEVSENLRREVNEVLREILGSGFQDGVGAAKPASPSRSGEAHA